MSHSPALVLFDDRRAQDWMPFALTRPVGELLLGALTLRERAERVFGLTCSGHLTADHLLTLDEPDCAPVLDRGVIPGDRGVLFLSSRAVPAWNTTRPDFDAGPRLIAIDGEPCGWYAPAGSEFPPAEFFDDPGVFQSDLPVHPLDGRIFEWPWQLITENAEQINRDIAALFKGIASADPGPGVHVLGSEALILGEGAVIEPGVVVDLRDGPVWVDAGARVTAFTRLAGPSYIGRNTNLLGGPFTSVSIGPMCKVHGEMEASVVLGYSNKAHDGFIGHAYIGRWVNLGALTTNSDLKNNYGSIRIWTPTGEADTGTRKLGCLLGDHVKTAIGTLLNTGTVVGAGSNLFGTRPPSKYHPPFCWGTDVPHGEYALEKFLETAEIVMSRRDVKLSAGQRALLEAAWKLGRGRA